MSRSRRKPIIKDKPRNHKASIYYRRVRRAVKQSIKKEEELQPLSREIVNDYDYCDYIMGFGGWWGHLDDDKWKRK
jgi:hypothetical protein